MKKRKYSSRFVTIIRRFPGTKILVVGDLMLDTFIWGDVSRISPEAPVPVFEKVRETFAPGGCGNVVENLHALGADVYVIGIIGKDANGQILMRDFARKGIHFEGVGIDHTRPTITKTRIIARNQQVLRLDTEKSGPIGTRTIASLHQHIQRSLPRCTAVIVSDYGKGVISPLLLRKIMVLAKKHRLPVMVDPKIEHFQQYKGITCMTPNIKEACAGMRWFKAETEEEVARLGKAILNKLKCRSVLITRGEKGMDLFELHKSRVHIPVTAKEVFDVTGAGDTVIAVLALAFSCKADLSTAAHLSSYAAGSVVGKVGTASISSQELIRVVRSVS